MFRRIADAALTAYFHALGIPAVRDLARACGRGRRISISRARVAAAG